jgi:hypothetical protein
LRPEYTDRGFAGTIGCGSADSRAPFFLRGLGHSVLADGNIVDAEVEPGTAAWT